ncbi:hypothetical protein [Acinetobacter tianfuensis]|uniref:Uncharacterized protein n=1 Tax=Acinetobacter tianfuensis TaxID=2419603 RepID=A0A3A8E3E6_9GAMM|nr:hypothetical protein [Acinetobacter tianfuensis]RKG29457.1 hypothetical protein D7V32_15000 [Acinetobacter tianfuensis]
MIGHQRDVLNALGIDLWIPKAQVCQLHQPAIWRDQAPVERIPEIILPSLQKPAENQSAAELKADVSAAAVQITEAAEPISAVEAEVRPILQIEPFVLESVSMEHCVLLIDAANLGAEEQLLWSNIQRAGKSEFSMLQWPFAWLKFQDGRGASSYVSGFIDAMREGNKNVLCLGSIPHLASSDYIQLASLQEMLQEPRLKKRLWQFMQNKPKDTVH